jgi:HSF-type DNA-binding
LNKFVRRLHDMLVEEKDGGVVEWRRGLLVLHSTDAFTKSILPKHFNTRNFKTFRRQVSGNCGPSRRPT